MAFHEELLNLGGKGDNESVEIPTNWSIHVGISEVDAGIGFPSGQGHTYLKLRDGAGTWNGAMASVTKGVAPSGGLVCNSSLSANEYKRPVLRAEDIMRIGEGEQIIRKGKPDGRQCGDASELPQSLQWYAPRSCGAQNERWRQRHGKSALRLAWWYRCPRPRIETLRRAP